MDLTQRFNRFNLSILRSIGKGTYGNVYLCKRKDNRYAIVKDIELNVKIQDYEQDVANEVTILSKLKHPNIVRFFDCNYLDQYVMISMEYATGGSLADYMYEKFPKLLKEEEILFFFSQILLGVNYIHSFDIIHRDLKADNIFLTGKGNVLVKIGDFGISKMLASAKMTSTVIGTPYYLAPELCHGNPYDNKSDIWALGCLLYEMCSHKRAFESESLLGLVKMITSGNVHPIDLNIYERGLQEIIDCMLTILPEKRPTVKEIMAKQVILPMVYKVYIDAGDDILLYDIFEKFMC